MYTIGSTVLIKKFQATSPPIQVSVIWVEAKIIKVTDSIILIRYYSDSIFPDMMEAISIDRASELIRK